MYEPAPARVAGTCGRPRLVGNALPKLQQVLDAADTQWKAITLAYWYGHTQKRLDVVTGTALWYHGGAPAVPLRWLLVRDPMKQLKTQAFLCTDQQASAPQILNWFVKRWQIEVTFEEARAHPGVQTRRQWSDRAIARTTPAILGLYSVVTLLAGQLLTSQAITVRQAAWYRKECATFSNTIALVRRCLWQADHLTVSGKTTRHDKNPDGFISALD